MSKPEDFIDQWAKDHPEILKGVTRSKPRTEPINFPIADDQPTAAEWPPPDAVERLARAMASNRGEPEPASDDYDDSRDALLAALPEDPRLPRIENGCACHFHPTPYGEPDDVEYEPACPKHSEHVYDPRIGMWVYRADAIEEGLFHD